MSVMDKFARMDTQLQRGLDNTFAFIFGGKVVREEIEELLKQQAQDNVREDDYDRLFAPNVYAVGVSSKDLENLSQDDELPASLADQLSRFGRNQGWEFVGPLVVRIAEESGLHTGQLRVSSYELEYPDVDSGFDAIFHEPVEAQNQTPQEETLSGSAAVPSHQQQAVSLLLQDGSSRTYHVHEGSNILGRSNDADLRLPDTGVSRQHAEITWDGNDAVLVDLQSTNGTTVNDNPIDNWLLADGDVITMGHSNIEVRINQSQNS